MVETHIPVMCEEMLKFLNPNSGSMYVDATVGLGGHSLSILQNSLPTGKLIGIDRDEKALSITQQRLSGYKDRFRLIHGNFAELPLLLKTHGISIVDGIVFDLGVSSLQLDSPERGFSFQHLGPLDMRMDTELPITAKQVVNNSTPERLFQILKEYGEERYSKRIVQHIVASRAELPIVTTQQLSNIVIDAIPTKVRRKATNHLRNSMIKRIHPATRVFQALRIEVNDELTNLKLGIESAVSVLKKDGCLCVISFHSLEDRIVKHCFHKFAKSCICPPKTPICICEHKKTLNIITKRPVLPKSTEIDENPRSRSAKMRAAIRI